MYKITETFPDFDGNERTEDFYFNFMESELAHMQFTTKGGLAGTINKIISTKDTPGLIAIFEELLQKSYGEKTPDGRGFRKSPELLQSFMETNAYSQIYMRLATDDKAGAEFINNVVPKKMQEAAKKAQQSKTPIPIK
jgi:hypothetical protein